MRILIIDDDRTFSRMLSFVLQNEGHEVDTAVDGVEGLDQLRSSGSPSVILLDMMMPRLDGEGFLKAMRSDPSMADTPIVIVTGHPTAREKAAKLGAVDCLVKPFELDELLSALRRAEHRPARAP